MSGESDLLELWDDLEQQAEGLALRHRDAEVADLARAEYAEVELAGRLVASVGREVELVLLGHGPLRGRVARVGSGWVLVIAEDGGEWLAGLQHLVLARGLGPQAPVPQARPLVARLGLGSVLRGLAERRPQVLLVRADGVRQQGTVGRVGRDFVEVLGAERSGVDILPFSALAALRTG